MAQDKLDLDIQKKLDTVEEYKFEPIKGYPMLHWKGKRPFTSTQYYPAQQKENYGEEVNGWMNKIFWGDNLQVMSHLLKDYRGKIDLIYIDPPFDSKADYKKKISLKGKSITNNHQAFEEKQYTDLWTNDGFLQFMYERLLLIKELLSDKGNIYVHLDEKRVHYVKLIMDEIFGIDNFQREIIWDITVLSGFKTQAQNWIRGHDTILYYSKNKNNTFNKLKQPHTQEYLDGFKKIDENGDAYMVAHKLKRYRKDVEFKGKPFGDVWGDIMSFQQQPTAEENVKYPTQKPETLLERIIHASSEPGSIVFDCFMGSGTTQAVAMRLGRKFIGADINLGAIETTVKRLNKVAGKISDNPPKLNLFGDYQENIDEYYTGFSIYNVNNYDVFRNPAQAKEILKQALEIQPLPNNTIYDGEKDGRMVKIMPVNRIATRADLNELISGFNYKSFQKKFEKQPNKPVENLLLVCMGHEPDLAATLQKEIHPYKIDIEVVDILRDKSNLEFKRDSEAEIVVEDNKLVIKQFYPMNLLQKLSIMKENVEDWKELVESVKVDFNYDDAVFEPSVVDIPEKEEMVIGEYDIPENAGTIRVKITDLLSESLEISIDN